jgi:hypothetical protein
MIEEIIPTIVTEGFTGDEFFQNLVEYRNIALGDDIDFWSEDNSLFVVSDIAHGTQALRRQRLNAGSKLNLTTTLRAIKIYEELNRLLAGRVDFNDFINRVGKSMLNQLYADIYTAFNGITSSTTGLNATYVVSASYAEDTLLDMIDHVEAATGKSATVYGTRGSLRKVTTAVVSENAKQDMNTMGYYGTFNGTPMVVARQRHQIGTDTFLLPANKLWIIAGDDKPVKVLDKGEGLFIEKDPMGNADLSKEYLYGQEIGTGVLVSEKLGTFTIA